MRLATFTDVRSVAAAIFLCSICSLAAAQDNRRAQQLEQLLKRHPEADADKDGKVTAQEARNHLGRVNPRSRATLRPRPLQPPNKRPPNQRPMIRMRALVRN